MSKGNHRKLSKRKRRWIVICIARATQQQRLESSQSNQLVTGKTSAFVNEQEEQQSFNKEQQDCVDYFLLCKSFI